MPCQAGADPDIFNRGGGGLDPQAQVFYIKNTRNLTKNRGLTPPPSLNPRPLVGTSSIFIGSD